MVGQKCFRVCNLPAGSQLNSVPMTGFCSAVLRGCCYLVILLLLLSHEYCNLEIVLPYIQVMFYHCVG